MPDKNKEKDKTKKERAMTEENRRDNVIQERYERHLRAFSQRK